MKKTTPKSWLSRTMALGLSAVLIGGVSLAGAAPASAAEEPVYYSVSGVVNTADGEGFAPLAGAEVTLAVLDPGFTSTIFRATTSTTGTFELEQIPAGTHPVEFAHDGYEIADIEVEVVDGDVVLPDVTLVALPAPDPDLTVGTVAITGTPVVGNVLAATTAGWPAGAALSYEWFYSGGEFGGPIDGANAASFTVTNAQVGLWIGVIVNGTMDGYTAKSVNAVLEAVTTSAPKEKAAPAPVSTSSGLTAYLTSKGSTPAAQTTTGLPAGGLSPDKAYTANVVWSAADSFVDVYMYSTPILVGTFPVVKGVAQITLSTTVLAQLAAGSHTLVVTGQTSGAVQSVSVSIAASLAATGFDAAVPVTLASILVLIGAALMSARFVLRRRSNQTT